jgi:site-specific DNA recombinase
MYVGVRVWNHKHHVRDPRTGKMAERPDAESELAFGGLLTGLIACGGKFGTIMPNRYGCLNHHRRAICTNNRTIRRDRLEKRALAGLEEKLVSRENVRAAVDAYAAHVAELNRERLVQAQTDMAALAKVEKGIAGMIPAIEDGPYQPAMKARMTELERQKAEIAARLAQAPQPGPAIHPNAYRRKVERLVETLDHLEIRHEAASALRSIVARIVLTPGEKRGQLHASLHGELRAIIDFANDNGHSAPAPLVMSQVSSGSRE